MTDFVDLHCHWLSEIDDGARSLREGVEMLTALKSIGFAHVVATPHMRPGMFNNSPEALKEAFQRDFERLPEDTSLPTVSLASEHFFDESVLRNIREGVALPYRESSVDLGEKRTGGAILIEFHDLTPMSIIERQLFELQTLGYIPVLAHPERYRATFGKPEVVERLIDLGSVALLDTAALVGKYGRRAKASAIELMKRGLYDAACTDSHRPSDVKLAKKGMNWIEAEYGSEEIIALFSQGPRQLLNGKRPTSG